jgi:hypothetical protein
MKPIYYRFILWNKGEIILRFDESKEQSVKKLMFDVAKYDNLLSVKEKAKLFSEHRVQNNYDYAQYLMRKANIEYELVRIFDYIIE